MISRYLLGMAKKKRMGKHANRRRRQLIKNARKAKT
jgi:hypothetical protein